MQFEIGKCYVHDSHTTMKIVGELAENMSLPFGAALVGEMMGEHGPELRPVRRGPDATDGWKRIPEDLYLRYTYPKQAPKKDQPSGKGAFRLLQGSKGGNGDRPHA